jgi:2,4-dienoyl-CoA reductase-like NADH-dependent reductase (Old Yellow Enzyme family)
MPLPAGGEGARPVSWPRVAAFASPDAFRAHLDRSAIALDFDAALGPPSSSPFSRPFDGEGVRVGNRFSILPMEGWDGATDGKPSELTRRRWRNFGRSGAKLIWGGEAVAVRHDGRANPNQLVITGETAGELARLRQHLVDAHVERFGSDRGLVVGLQLTHSGRFARPNAHDRAEPLVAYRHPLLDRRFPAGVHLLRDDELDRLVTEFVAAGVLARELGFEFVDVKHCHGYLGHELLSAREREGRYGGCFENRTRFLRAVVAALRRDAKGLGIGVRFSVFDTVPWRKGREGVGEPEPVSGYSSGFGLLSDGLDTALEDARELLRLLESLDVRWVCTTAGSPYYNPHVQRPALFPPMDGYLPPEDPLRGVARQIEATARLKAEFPRLAFVGSAYSYLQEWLPNVGQRVLRDGKADFVGLGRMVLAYPELPADVLEGRPLRRKSICRTFSDCTTAPRSGLVSGCYPLDPFYAGRPEAEQLRRVKQALRA